MSDRATKTNLIDELQWRGLIKDCTDESGLRDHLADPDNAPRKIYCGFDPTSDSLTIGNLVPIMMLAHVRRAGHTPIVVMGGGTGLIGDPSGKSAERQMMTKELVEHNVSKQRAIFENVLGQIDGPDYEIKNNLDWLGSISYIDALRDIGKHFSVNMMMQKESVKERLHNREQGISYTEFSYMILQAYDFAHLYEKESVTVQFGGSDQYGNIVAGTDLIRRKRASLADTLDSVVKIFRDHMYPGRERTLGDLIERPFSTLLDSIDGIEQHLFDQIDLLMRFFETLKGMAPEEKEGFEITLKKLRRYRVPNFGLTAPLVKKADGTKFGKTEDGAIWLTAARTSPYAYYQFWLNASDKDVAGDDENPGWIKIFTFLTEAECDALIQEHNADPSRRVLQRKLAQEATTILHGERAMKQAEEAGKALFSGDIASLDEPTLLDVFANIESSTHALTDLDQGIDPVELLKSVGLASSNREAREFLANGSVSVNGQRIDPDTTITRDHLLHGSIIAIRRGKKNWRLTRWA